jgi:hypothetical protein
MNEKYRELWAEKLRCGLAEFISRPDNATQAGLEMLLAEYRRQVEEGTIPLYRYRAA